MSRSPDLERKLDVLMSLAADDREGLPPRLRHARSTGALNPINIRHLRPLPGMRMSLRIASGRSARAFSTASDPSRAFPTTSKP